MKAQTAVIQRIGARERQYVLEVLDSQFRGSASGGMIQRLERKFAEVFESKYAISFINGTATMHAALAAAGVGPGDEVIVPPLTMASTSFAVLHAGAVPVFADIAAREWTIDPRSIEKHLTPRTKAIIPVAIYGLSPDMDAIMLMAERHKLFVLEDDAQCVLGRYRGRINGSIAHASSFSFQSSKQMTSGEGGMVTTNDAALADGIRRFNSLGYAAVGASSGKISRETIQDPAYLRHASLGWNYRMPELCAAVLLAQTERVQELVDCRIRAARLYAQAVSGCGWLVPQAVPESCVHTYWTYVLKLDNQGGVGWHEFRRKFVDFGGDGIYGAWQLTYLEPAFRDKKFYAAQSQRFVPGLCPVAEELQPNLLQFKTNYLDEDRASRAAEILHRTIRHFD